MTVCVYLIFGWLNWQVAKTDHFTVVYKPGYEWEAQQVLNNLEWYRSPVVGLTGNDTRNVPIVVEDAGLISNGFADPLIYTIHVYTNPGGMAGSLEGMEDWYRLVSVHEYIHIAHLTKTSGFPKVLSGIFGFPFHMNNRSPGWIIEGIAVYGESQQSSYEGRLNDGYFDALIAAKVNGGRFPSLIEATNSPMVFPQGGYYVYGGEFFNFLADRYGEEKFAEFFRAYGANQLALLSPVLPCLGLDRSAKKVFGRSFPGLYAEWRSYEEARFAEWQPDAERITHDGWYIPSYVRDGDKLYYVRTVPVKLDAFVSRTYMRLIEFDTHTRQERIMALLTSPIATSMKVHNGSLYYATLEIKRTENVSQAGFGYTAVMHRVDLVTGNDVMLFKDDIRNFCVMSDNSILYVKDRAHAFGSELWCYEGGVTKRYAESDHLINELATDGAQIVVVARSNGENWSIYRMQTDHVQGSILLEPLMDSPWIEGAIQLTGDSLYFTANYDKQYRIYMFDMQNEKLYRMNENGFAYNGMVIDDSLYFLGLSDEGVDVFKTPAVYETQNIDDEQPAPALSLDDISFHRGNYLDISKTLLPDFRLPLFYPADTTLTKWVFGMLLLGGDITYENSYQAFIAYDQAQQSPVVQATATSLFFLPVVSSFSFEYDESVAAGFSYPAFVSLNSGLSRLAFSAGFRSHDRFGRKELRPGVSMRVHYPLTSLGLSFSLPMERESWQSAVDRTAQVAGVQFKQIIFDGELRFMNTLYNDPDEPDTPSIEIRGDTSLTAFRGWKSTAEYSHRLLKLRWGLWDPNIYFEDLFATMFFDYGLSSSGENIYSAGVELKLETKAGFGAMQFVPAVGIAVTKERDIVPYFKLGMGTIFDLYE